MGSCVNFGQWPFSSLTSSCLDNLGAVSDCDCKTWYCELLLCDVKCVEGMLSSWPKEV